MEAATLGDISSNCTDVPWLDRGDWQAKLDRLHNQVDEATRAHLKTWAKDGYILLESLFDAESCDALVKRTHERVWTNGDLPDGNRVTGLVDRNGAEIGLNPSDLASLDANERQRLLNECSWRYHRFAFNDELASKFAHHPEVIRLTSLIFGEPSAPKFSISFGNGSTQELHQDIAVFHIQPEGYLIGAWIALEDITQEAGPLRYYPGSHRLGLWGKHREDYPYTNVRTLSRGEKKEYEEWLEGEGSEPYQEKLLTVPKGSVLLWHSHLIHGGAPWTDRTKSRNSLVVHYLPTSHEVNVANKITSPTLW